MHHRALCVLLLFASSTLALASSTIAVPSVTVSPASLNFGTVAAGQVSTLVLNIKNGGTATFKAGATVTTPYTLTPAALSFTSLSSVNVTVTLPANATIGAHNGSVTITLPSATSGGLATEVKVPVTGTVSSTAGSGIDLKVDTINVKSCGVNAQGTFRSCSINVPLLTTGIAPQAAKTTLFEARGTSSLTQTMDQLLVYNPPGATPFIYAMQNLPLDITNVTIKVIVDSDNKVAESNEGNNTVTMTLSIGQ